MTLQTILGVFRKILVSNTSIKNLVAERIYPLNLPLSCSFPAISFLKVSDPYSRVSGSPRFQVDSWAESLLGVELLSKTIEEALDGYSGVIEGWRIENIIPLDCQEATEETESLFHLPYDYKVIFRK